MFSLYFFHSIYICFQGVCDKDLQMVHNYGGNNTSSTYMLVPILKIWNTGMSKKGIWNCTIQSAKLVIVCGLRLLMNITVLWDMMLHWLVISYWRGACCLHLWSSQRGILTSVKLQAPCELWNINTSFRAKSVEWQILVFVLWTKNNFAESYAWEGVL